MARKKESCALKRWALALARKLAVILHAIWMDGTWFEDKPKTITMATAA